MLLQLSEDRFPHNTEAGHPADHDLCTHRMTDEFKEDCRTVVNQFGLHMVDTLVSENPDSICSLMSSCNSAHLNSLYPDEEVLVSDGVRAQARATAEAAVKQYMATQGNHYQKEWQEAEEALDQENGDEDDEADEADDDDDDDEKTRRTRPPTRMPSRLRPTRANTAVVAVPVVAVPVAAVPTRRRRTVVARSAVVRRRASEWAVPRLPSTSTTWLVP
eukprot:TRINITY_DN18_c0_g1_i8.p2 TRINITY_DN18_c0_g1~~TRINITY_DN18_c0_g1_i8.p2  ORF type:complete len:218 (+),score=24.86 TRINITY_DN18_c0_g1_i8:427-1080(+)